MQTADREASDAIVATLCAGFNQPPTEARKTAYFAAFRRLSVGQFRILADRALTEGRFDELPTVGQLWQLWHGAQPQTPAVTPVRGPTVAEQLCEYVARHYPGGRETYLYREWIDPTLVTAANKEGRGAECTGVLIERDGFPPARVTVEQMRGATS